VARSNPPEVRRAMAVGCMRGDRRQEKHVHRLMHKRYPRPSFAAN
jgi:hypothetical protein